MPKIKNQHRYSPRFRFYKQKAEDKTLIEEFQEKPGILFGLSDARDNYFSKLKKLNYDFFAAHHFNLKNNFIDNYLDNKLTPEIIQELPEEQKKYLNLLKKNSRILNPGGKDPFGESTPKKQRRGIIIRRTCKLLARCGEYQTYFILDDIDMERVCSKKIEEEIDTAITGAELRAVFRQSLTQRNGSLSHVKFFKENKPVQPPWVQKESHDFFEAYKKAREFKLGLKT